MNMSASENEPLLQNSLTNKISTVVPPKSDVCLTLPVEEVQGECDIPTGQQNEKDEVSHSGSHHDDPVTPNNIGLIQNLFWRTLCSGNILIFFATIFGLWPVRRKQQIVIVTVLTAINIFAVVYVIHEIFINFEEHDFSFVDNKYFVTFSVLYTSWFVLIPSTCLLSYLLMFHYAIFRSRKEHVLTIHTAFLKTSRMEWLAVNIQFFLACCFLTAYFVKAYLDFCKNCTVLEHISQLSLFCSAIGLVLTCMIFEVLMCALHKCAFECKTAICNLPEGSLDTVINIHQDLCDHVFTTCRAMQFWFVAVLVLLGIESIETILFGLAYGCFIKNDPYLSFPIILFSYLFVVLCLYASHLTCKCQRIICEINNSRTQDWKVEHPFHKRKTLNHFIFYANGVNCGFRVFIVTIGDKFGWSSVIVSIVTVGIKILFSNC